MIEDLCESPLMLGERSDRIRELIRPFDDHFATRKPIRRLGPSIRHRSDAWDDRTGRGVTLRP